VGVSDDDGEGAIPPEGKFPQESGRVDAPQYSEPAEPDPHDLGPPIPEAPDPTETDAEIDPAVHALFWWLVLVFNAALLALSLGVMIAAFDGKYALGAQIFAVGAVLFGYGYLRYRKFEREKEEGDADGEDDADAHEGATAGDGDVADVDADEWATEGDDNGPDRKG
jgi:hypothetical protein